jgi:hypothetical protein
MGDHHQIRDAFYRFEREHGTIPTSRVWDKLSRGNPNIPDVATVRNHLGSWNKALADMGFETRARGALGHLVPTERYDNGRFVERYA